MAAATTSASTIDLRTQATYPLRLGTSILKPAESRRWTSVRYNHKPRLQKPGDVKYTIKRGNEEGQEELSLQDGKEEFQFSGRGVSSGAQYVLLSKGRGNGKELVLEKLDACHEFNLIKTPSETDAAKLASQFPQLSAEEEDDELFGDEEAADDPVDPSNPWDYRNYLKSNVEKARPRDAAPKDSATSTPQHQPRAASSTPISRPTKRSDGPLVSQKKRKAPATSKEKPNPKRVKAGTEPPVPVSTPNKPSTKPRPEIPRVQVDRKATLVDDSGELILENETPISQKAPKQQGSMALALSGQLGLGEGPISLHSAANSPASKIASPMPPRPEGMEEGEEFEFGGSSSPEAAPVKTKEASRAPPPEEEEGELSDEDADADADVEDLELPSPAQTHRKSVSAANVAAAADDDDDLDKQLALAMAEEEDEAAPPPLRQAESDEESEEE